MPRLLLIAAALLLSLPLRAQTTFLDPTRDLPTQPQTHSALPEQYLWTANDITAQRPDHSKFPWNRPTLRTDPHFFRTAFAVANPPQAATLYLAGPRSARVWINGTLAATFTSDIDAPINFHVFHVDVAALLRPGSNTLAIEAVRGRGIVAATGSVTTQQITYGEVLAAKIVAAPFGVPGSNLVISQPLWKSSTVQTVGWNQPAFDDKSWPPVATLGPIEDNPDFFQWNADAGMYEWPGYMGMSPGLRTLAIAPVAITHIYEGAAHVSVSGAKVTLASFTPETDSESPAILVDFGREIAGRLLVESASPCDATLSVAYGESEIEALATGLSPGQKGGNYLGTNLLHVPPGGIARGPKSGFHYARIRFLRGCANLTFASIRAEAIYYPVTYGSFETSDPVLNRIWETGAYTAHLCMQDGIWDAPKRDRGQWVGDLDVEGRVISTAFGDSALLEDTLRRMADATKPSQYVDGIASYSALWLTSLDTLYTHSGDLGFLETQRVHILQILARMDQDIDPRTNLLSESIKGWGFVDWAPAMYGATKETRIGTNLQYLRGYAAGTRLLQALNDPALATYAARTRTLTAAASQAYADPGNSWQLNALAALTLTDNLGPFIRFAALFDYSQNQTSDPVISPYFNSYLLDAIGALNPYATLNWIRSYWGGMLAEGATSFWESYDLRWPKDNPHLSLQADGTSGLFVSLAHGWSAGPTAWLTENILGIRPTAPGYATVSINPDLAGLDWAKGTVPTPRGPITVSVDKSRGLTVDLPADITASVVYDNHTRLLTTPGHHAIP